MLPTNFTPAHSRRLALTTAICLLLIAWASSHSRILVAAAESPGASSIDAISEPVLPAVPGTLAQLSDDNGGSDGSRGYAPDFQYFGRSLLGRQEAQEPQVNELKNNEKKDMEIAPGATTYFVFKRGQSRVIRSDDDSLEALEARGASNASGDNEDRHGLADQNVQNGDDEDAGSSLYQRQAGNRVWISANTCRQPLPSGSETPKNHPQLVMFVSTSADNQRPGLDSTDDLKASQTTVPFEEGLASFDANTTSDIYVGVSAPPLSKDWDGSWSFELAASVDGPYHSYNATNTFLYMIDTDSDSALFITYNISEPNTNETDKWKENNPFSMYAFEVGDQSAITGMEHSLCALKDLFSNSSINTTTTITTKFGADLPKSQFHIHGLKNGTKYNGFLTVEGGKDVVRLPGGETVRAGGMVFQNFTFTTKAGMSL